MNMPQKLYTVWGFFYPIHNQIITIYFYLSSKKRLFPNKNNSIFATHYAGGDTQAANEDGL
jgi:hypothetical protein